jgi:poly(3-hydroxybutyrate) depolymerase
VDGRTELVRPQDITTTAMLTVEGELDDISGSGQTAAAHDLCTGIANKNRQHLEVPGAGHYGIFSGRRWRDVVYPEVRQFILNHAATAAKAPVKAVAPAPAVQALAKPAAVKKAAPAAAPVKRPEVTPVAVKETPVAVKATPKVAVKAAPKATAKPLAKQAAVKVPVKATVKANVKAPVKAPAKVNAKPASKAAAKTPSVKTAWVDTAKPKAKA